MALSGLSVLSFFSQIAMAILFKKKNRTSSKIPHKIYIVKFQNSFLIVRQSPKQRNRQSVWQLHWTVFPEGIWHIPFP